MAALETSHWWFVGRRRILTIVLSTFTDLPSQCNILEVGCGTGGNLGMLSQFGQVYALEPNEKALELADQKGNFDIRKGSLPNDIPFDIQTFDLIAALDILEHISEDFECLTTFRNLLRPNGWLLLTVPAFPFLWSTHDDDHHHKRRYNKANLQHIVQEAGFSQVMVTYFNTLLFPLAVSLRLINKTLHLKGFNGEVALPATLNTVLTGIFASERHVIKHCSLPVGLSLLLLAKKAS